MTFLANSKGQPLKNHLIAVAEMARCIAVEKLRKEMPQIENAVYLGGLLHDIGKVDHEFQSVIGDAIQNVSRDGKNTKPTYFHNEISLAIFDQLSESGYTFNLDASSFNGDRGVRRLARYAIYWHHPERRHMEMESPNEIDTSKIIPSVIEVLKEVSLETSADSYSQYTDKAFPPFFAPKNNNALNFIVLTIVNEADRIISKLTPDALERLIEKKNYRDHIEKFGKPIAYNPSELNGIDLARLKMQDDIATESLEHRTVQINAPTAFGKTFIMLLRALKSGKRTYIVCPTNTISQNIYWEMIDAIKLFNVNIDIELYLGSTRRQMNNVDSLRKEFESQIVVTNIDNYIKAFNHTDHYYTNYSVVDSDLIIDEFHELMADSPMFAVTVDVLKMRNSFLKNSTTMLLSATPSLLGEYIHDSVVQLPAKMKHYPSVNKQVFNFRSTVDAPHKLDCGAICILNSIKNVQTYSQIHNISNMLHSNYVEQDKKRNKDTFFRLFGKQAAVTDKLKNKAVASLVVQSSLNISFNEVFDSCLSAESTLQRLGRNSRFGEYATPTFTIFTTKDIGECAVGRIHNSDELKNKWYQHFTNAIALKSKMTLDEVYEIYHAFLKDNQIIIKERLDKLYASGVEKYGSFNMQPKRRSEYATEAFEREGVRAIGGLRDPMNGFFVAPRINKRQYKPHVIGEVDSMNIQHNIFNDHWIKSDFSKKDDKFWLGEIKKLIAVGYIRWATYVEEYELHKKKKKSHSFFTDDRLKEAATWSETPLPGINYEYDEVIGLRDVLKKVNY